MSLCFCSCVSSSSVGRLTCVCTSPSKGSRFHPGMTSPDSAQRASEWPTGPVMGTSVSITDLLGSTTRTGFGVRITDRSPVVPGGASPWGRALPGGMRCDAPARRVPCDVVCMPGGMRCGVHAWWHAMPCHVLVCLSLSLSLSPAWWQVMPCPCVRCAGAESAIPLPGAE